VTPPRFILGIDVGQAHDFTALVILERVGAELHARHIERLPLGTSYPDQVARIAALVDSSQLGQNVLVAVDGMGVGRAVVDLLREALRPFHAPLVAITITGGASATRVGSLWTVPKRDLVASAQVALQTKQLKIAAGLPAAQTLVDELTAYRLTISDDGRDTFGNGRSAPNDDLVLALALGVYTANRRIRRTRITHAGPELSPRRQIAERYDGVIGVGLFR
jgi:hypothetical protein